MTGRNDPCWCGSGKKYKKCHLSTDSPHKVPDSNKSTRYFIKNDAQIQGMRKAGRFNGILMDYIRPYIKPGISTEEINRLVHEYTVNQGHIPACLGYHSFPKSVCISINDVVCHGIPNQSTILMEGDIVNVDLTTIVEGYYGDSSETFFIGTVPDAARQLVLTTAEALLRGIAAVAPGKTLNAIANAIEPFVEERGYSVVRQYTGHGIGKEFHEHYSVCHHRTQENERIVMEPGMTFTIEPMINIGNYRVVTDSVDGWTVRTKDGSLSAQFEHTVLVTATGAEVLTQTPSQIEADIFLAIPK